MPEIKILKPNQFPELLKEIPDGPKELFVEGDMSSLFDENAIYLAVVGTRKFSTYGKESCRKILGGLRNYNFVIVSGLAIGIDAIAHRVALDNNLRTIAVPGSGLDRKVLHPRSNHSLAEEIINSSGCLLSEMEPEMPAGIHTFPQRNRIVAGLCHAVLVIEGPERSGTSITARLALEYNRDVLAIPGSIFNENSKGTNKLIKEGATPITSADDILEFFKIAKEGENLKLDLREQNLSPIEEKILSSLIEPMQKDDLIRKIGLPTHEINPTLTMMQINGLIKESGGEIFRT